MDAGLLRDWHKSNTPFEVAQCDWSIFVYLFHTMVVDVLDLVRDPRDSGEVVNS